jgi:predicted dehydrogenase
MAQKIYNWGIIGPGKIARKFADGLQLLPNACLHAVASTVLERAQAFAANYQCPNAFGSYQALMDCPDLDIVYIATPHVKHYEHTMLCLNHGIPAVCEKPFSMSMAQTKAMVDLARTKKVFLMEALWTLFMPSMAAAVDMAASGVVGDIHSAKADFGFYAPYNKASRLFDPQLGGGSLLDIGIYPILFFQRLFGKPSAENIQAAAVFTPDGVDESCVFTFKYPDNRLAFGHSTVAADTPIEAIIFGTKGRIHIHSRFHHAQQVSVFRHENGPEPEVYHFPYEGWGYHFEAAHVMDCLDAGKTESDLLPLSFTMDLAETLATVSDKIGLKYPEALLKL